MAFLTGSRVYGKPREDSDIDLVILVDESTYEILSELGELGKEPIRFGRLNLIVCTDLIEYSCWLVGTEQMRLSKLHTGVPIDKEQAKATLDEIRSSCGRSDWNGPSG